MAKDFTEDPCHFFPWYLPGTHWVGIIGGKRERNGGRCFQKRNAILLKVQEQLDRVLCTVPSAYTTEIPATSYESWNPFSFCDSDKWDLNSVVGWTAWKGTPWDHGWGCNEAAHTYSHAGWVPWYNTMGVWRSRFRLNELSHLNNTKGGMLFMQNLITCFGDWSEAKIALFGDNVHSYQQ